MAHFQTAVKSNYVYIGQIFQEQLLSSLKPKYILKAAKYPVPARQFESTTLATLESPWKISVFAATSVFAIDFFQLARGSCQPNGSLGLPNQ